MSQPKLSEEAIQDHLAKLPGWSYVDNVITKMYTFANFIGSIQFVNLVAQDAESINHHPDIDIRYNKVTISLTTHDSDGITMHDVQLAASCDDFADQIAK